MRPFGVDFHSPLTQLREYLTVLRTLLHDGEVEFEGRHVRARARIARPLATPVMASALQLGAFELCGELADGAITWVCPVGYLERQALPALRRGAERAGREPPPLVMHVPIAVEEDAERVREAAQRTIGAYPRLQFYGEMFAAAGYPDAAEGLSPGLVDELVVHGSEQQVAEGLRARLELGGGEVMAFPLVIGDDRAGSMERCMAAVGRAARED